MISALARFVEALRREGLSPSPAEVLDATRAVDVLGVEDRARFRAALATTLAKGHRSRATFDRVFDRFFVAPERARGKKKGKTGAGGDGRSRTGRGRPGETVPPPRRTLPERKGSGERSRAEDRVGRLLQEGEGTGRRAARLRRVLGSRRPDVEGATPAAAADRDPRRTDLHRPLTTEEERRLAEEVPRLIRAVRLRSGRRFRRSVRGRPWPQRVFRENLGREGVPFVLPYRVSRPRKSRIVLLVDVSWSTAAAAGYFLWMASAFLTLGRQVRVFAFVDRPVEVTSRLGAWVRGGSPAEAPPPRRRRLPGTGIRPAGVSFASFLDRVPGIDLNAPSDYGRVFYDLYAGAARLRARDTVLVVLGDGRTNRFDPLPWAFEELSRRSRLVLWMVPEPSRRWGTGDSALRHYLPWTDVAVEARDLDGLGRGLVELLRRL
jgi:uncharacterized protein with von Willebrand factor type A (vWA) domain